MEGGRRRRSDRGGSGGTSENGPVPQGIPLPLAARGASNDVARSRAETFPGPLANRRRASPPLGSVLLGLLVRPLRGSPLPSGPSAPSSPGAASDVQEGGARWPPAGGSGARRGAAPATRTARYGRERSTNRRPRRRRKAGPPRLIFPNKGQG